MIVHVPALYRYINSDGVMLQSFDISLYIRFLTDKQIMCSLKYLMDESSLNGRESSKVDTRDHTLVSWVLTISYTRDLK